jgi:uncharacterized membrane protein
MANNTTYQPHKSSIGDIDANYVAVACYGAAVVFSYIPLLKYLAWLAPLVIYFLEKKSVLVKFHAVQALILNAVGAVLTIILAIVGAIIRGIIKPVYDYNSLTGYTDYYSKLKTYTFVGTLFGLIALAVAVLIMVMEILAALSAYKYSEYKIPIIGGIANKVSEKLSKVDFGGTNNAAPPAQGYTPPAQQWTPPAQPYTPPAQPYTPPAPPVAQQFDTETGLPITPPAPPAQPMFDTETGQPINPPQ